MNDDGRSGISNAAEHAADSFREAEKLERREPLDGRDAVLKGLWAERARADGEALLKAPRNLVGDASTEIVPAASTGEKLAPARRYLLDTLEHPNMISVDASEQRASVATRANVLSPAIDAAVSGGARNSLETMLCHQLAAVHMAGMDLLVRVQQSLVDWPPVERARLTIAAARMFEVYQSGCLTLLKLKTRGRQRVLVQHQQVNVGPGGRRWPCGRGLAQAGEASRKGSMNPMSREPGPLKNGNPRGDLRRCGSAAPRPDDTRLVSARQYGTGGAAGCTAA